MFSSLITEAASTSKESQSLPNGEHKKPVSTFSSFCKNILFNKIIKLDDSC